MATAAFRTGDRVQLRRSVCANSGEAEVSVGNILGDSVFLKTPLEGFRWWNASDLRRSTLVKARAESRTVPRNSP
jgi:hypothetical protein